MPGFDGTGPQGQGPMTGGGRGLCNPRAIGWAWVMVMALDMAHDIRWNQQMKQPS
jgi:hypothetical protein